MSKRWTPRFLKAVAFVLEHEGGYVDDADDAGGETKYGISRRSFPDVDIAGLTLEGAVAIYFEHFWRPEYDQIRDERLAVKVFDVAVNMGHARAHRILQYAINDGRERAERITEDGVIGPVTLAAIEAEHRLSLYHRFLYWCEVQYREFGNEKYLTGWLNRLYDEPPA